MAFIESHQELARHPKTKKLARQLKISIPTAIGHLHLLWYWCYDYADDGNLGRYDHADIADAMLWEGNPDDLIAAMLDAKFLDHDEHSGDLLVHDWDNYSGEIIKRRKADTQRKREARLHLDPPHVPPSVNGHQKDVSGLSDGHPADGARTVPNLTVPNLTVPNRTVPNRTVPNHSATTVAGDDLTATPAMALVETSSKPKTPKVSKTEEQERVIRERGMKLLCDTYGSAGFVHAKEIGALHTLYAKHQCRDPDELIALWNDTMTQPIYAKKQRTLSFTELINKIGAWRAKQQDDRTADAISAALIAVCGTPETDSEEDEWMMAAIELRRIRASPEDIRGRAEAMMGKWEKDTIRPGAILRNWSQFEGKSHAEQERRARDRAAAEDARARESQRLANEFADRIARATTNPSSSAIGT